VTNAGPADAGPPAGVESAGTTSVDVDDAVDDTPGSCAEVVDPASEAERGGKFREAGEHH